MNGQNRMIVGEATQAGDSNDDLAKDLNNANQEAIDILDGKEKNEKEDE